MQTRFEGFHDDWTIRTLTVGPLLMNAYLLSAPAAGECLLVDPGDDPEVLLQAIDDSGCRLSGLVCTHGHFDHISAAAAVQREWDLPLLHHRGDAFLVNGLNATRALYGFPPTETPRTAEFPAERLAFAGGEIELRHAPGHCPGHVLLVAGAAALVGDVIFQGSIGRTDLPGGDFEVLAASIREQVYSLDEETVLLPGHGPSTTVGEEMRTNPFVRQS